MPKRAKLVSGKLFCIAAIHGGDGDVHLIRAVIEAANMLEYGFYKVINDKLEHGFIHAWHRR